MYKIIAVDADGTLLDRSSRIPPENKAALLAAQRAGVHIALCSGRSIVSLSMFADELELDPENSHIISFNGGAIFDGHKRPLRSVRMNSEILFYIYDKVRDFKLTMGVYTETDRFCVMLPGGDRAEYDDYYRNSLVKTVFTEDFREIVEHDAYKLLLIGDNKRLLETERFMRESGRDMPYEMFLSSPKLLEFTDIRSTKAAGLDFVCKRLGLEMSKEAIAIGDSFNDLSMIKSAALGVCMVNGEENVKLAADYVTDRDNQNCGVAEVLRKFIFGDIEKHNKI